MQGVAAVVQVVPLRDGYRGRERINVSLLHDSEKERERREKIRTHRTTPK